MQIEFNGKKLPVVAWHEDATKPGNFVLTLRTQLGREIHAIERVLEYDQVKQLKREVPKDSTGL